MNTQSTGDGLIHDASAKPDVRLFSPSMPPSIAAFVAICSQRAESKQYPLALSMESNVPVYKLAPFHTTTPQRRAALQDEWYRVLLSGPGVFVVKGLFPDRDLMDRVNGVFRDIIKMERERAMAPGDHFAGAGKNDRIWNAFSKHGIADPASFLLYYSNPYLSLIASAWLGPGYRVTAQVNNVKPGAAAQVCHRDYHLGFMSAERCCEFPRAVQMASQCLTLQGAVAHVDVPVESGPTRLLPFSQTFAAGYVAYRLAEFSEFFRDNYVALPLDKGDGLFFNPALFHAAGANESADIHRLANLLQISSALGKPMESVNTLPLVESCWPDLQQLYREQGLSDEVKAFVSAIGEGYPFPTNLDRNPPRADDMAPVCEQDVIVDCLKKRQSKEATLGSLRAYRQAARA